AAKYHSMIGALMYLTSSRPDIVHATCLCARYQAKPTKKYLKEDSGFELTGFSDADYAGCKDTFKSTSGGAQFLGEKLVSWSLKKQDCMALSTAKAEYESLSACYAHSHILQPGSTLKNKTHRCPLPFHKGARGKCDGNDKVIIYLQFSFEDPFATKRFATWRESYNYPATSNPKVHAIEVPGWVPEFEKDGEEGYDVNDGSHEDDMYGGVSENLKDVEGKSDREEVPEINFEEVLNKSIFEGNSVRQNDVHSDVLFGIYEVLNKKRDGKYIDDKHEDSLKYPPGFTPNEEGDVPVEKVDNWSDENKVNDGQEDGKPEVPHKGGSILELIDDLVNVRQTIGYD
nr:hypothetical protein [Tanacetum cinerariifolium]